MGRAQPVDLGHISFRTKTEAKKYFSDMLQGYSVGDLVGPADEEDLRAVLIRHPDASEKIGCGIKQFEVREDGEFGGKCFWLVRTDGDATDVSFRKCIDEKNPSLRQEFAAACRNAVWTQIREAKKQAFRDHGDDEGKIPCEVSGERLAIDQCHIDHAPPLTFQVLVETFINARKLEVTPDMMSERGDGTVTTKFVDEDVRDAWVDYHTAQANLRIVKPFVNLSQSARNRIRKPKLPIRLN